MHINSNFRAGGDVLVNMPFHTSNLLWRSKGSCILPAAGSCTVGRGLTKALLLVLPPRPGFNHLPVPSCLCSKPTQPQLPLTHKELCEKVEKTTSLAPMSAQLLCRPSAHHPVLQVMVLLGEAAGGADGGERYSAQGQLLIVLRFCVQNCTTLDETTDRIAVT